MSSKVKYDSTVVCTKYKQSLIEASMKPTDRPVAEGGLWGAMPPSKDNHVLHTMIFDDFYEAWKLKSPELLLCLDVIYSDISVHL